MLQISAVIKELKNQLSSDSCWILLLELDTKIEGLEPIRVARNNEDIAYRGNTYIAFPLEPPTISEDTTGSIPSFELSIGYVVYGRRRRGYRRHCKIDGD